MGLSSGNIPGKMMVGSQQNPPMNTNLSFAVSNLTDSENTWGRHTATDLSGYPIGDSPKDATKTTLSTANPVSKDNYDLQIGAPLKSLGMVRTGGAVMMRSNTIDEGLMGQFGDTAKPNLLFGLEPRILEDGCRVSSNSIVDFMQTPAHM
jgi:hypothetical protein